MKWRLLRPFVVFLATCTFASLGQQVVAAGPNYPSHVSDTMNSVIAKARKTWRRDSVVNSIALQYYPADTTNPNVIYWLAIRLVSPSNGASRVVQVGGPMDGDINDSPAPRDPAWRSDPRLQSFQTHIPDFKIDLPEAIAVVRHVGLKDRLFSVELDMVGATGTTPLPAWEIRVFGAKSLYPLPVDAQTGAILNWKRVYDRPTWTDAEMKAIWDRLLNRNQPPPQNHGGLSPWECVAQIQEIGITSCY
jgi:hypothetical protein